MDDDRILKVIVVGIISTIIAEIASRVFLAIGIGKYSVYQLNSLIITLNRPSETIGFILNIIVGSALSVLLFLVLKRWGNRYVFVECLMASSFIWLLYELFFTLAIENKTIEIRPINDYYNHMVGTIIFGLSMGLLLKRFIFKKTAAAVHSR